MDDDRTGECQWFALCANDATATRSHPILGDVPICKRCDDWYIAVDNKHNKEEAK